VSERSLRGRGSYLRITRAQEDARFTGDGAGKGASTPADRSPNHRHLPSLRDGVARAWPAVLTITKLANVEYVLRQVAQAIYEYYTGRGEAPGVWQGGLAAEFGLVGVVEGGSAVPPQAVPNNNRDPSGAAETYAEIRYCPLTTSRVDAAQSPPESEVKTRTVSTLRATPLTTWLTWTT